MFMWFWAILSLGAPVTTVENIKENDVLLTLMSTLTLNGLLVLKSAINHVPPTYSMRRKDFQGFSLRSVIIHEIMATCASECCLTLSDVYFYVSFLERHCPKFISTSEFLPKDKLWKLCDGCRYRYAKFLSPPLQCCLQWRSNYAQPTLKAHVIHAWRPDSCI